MSDLYRRLTSRKFILAVTGAVALFSQGQYEAAAGVIVAWLVAEGYVDSKYAEPIEDAVGRVEDTVRDVHDAVSSSTVEPSDDDPEDEEDVDTTIRAKRPDDPAPVAVASVHWRGQRRIGFKA